MTSTYFSDWTTDGLRARTNTKLGEKSLYWTRWQDFVSKVSWWDSEAVILK